VKKGQEAENKLHCEKKYEAKAGGGGGGGESDSADEDFDDEEEVQGPDEDAGLSVEELRAKCVRERSEREGGAAVCPVVAGRAKRCCCAGEAGAKKVRQFAPRCGRCCAGEASAKKARRLLPVVAGRARSGAACRRCSEGGPVVWRPNPCSSSALASLARPLRYAKAGEATEGEPAAKKQKKEEEEVEDF
jgi:hypothetical protein